MTPFNLVIFLDVRSDRKNCDQEHSFIMAIKDIAEKLHIGA